jgi:hypothetical protein
MEYYRDVLKTVPQLLNRSYYQSYIYVRWRYWTVKHIPLGTEPYSFIYFFLEVFFIYLAQHPAPPSVCQGPLISEVFRSHTTQHSR